MQIQPDAIGCISCFPGEVLCKLGGFPQLSSSQQSFYLLKIGTLDIFVLFPPGKYTPWDALAASALAGARPSSRSISQVRGAGKSRNPSSSAQAICRLPRFTSFPFILYVFINIFSVKMQCILGRCSRAQTRLLSVKIRSFCEVKNSTKPPDFSGISAIKYNRNPVGRDADPWGRRLKS